MKTEDTLLIGKFLEGSITEKESQSLLHKLESNEISADEFHELVKMHSLLYAEFHIDKNSEKLSAIVNRAIGEKKSNLSERVIRRIESKKKKNFNWVLAAILFLSVLAGAFFLTQTPYKTNKSEAWSLITTNNSIATKTLISSNSISNETPLLQTYELPDGSIIELYPNSTIKKYNNQIFLEKGKLLANIKKQKIPLNFGAGDSICNIIGTKFILETSVQNAKATSELIVTEGLVAMNAFNKTEMVKANQRCIATSYNQKLVLNNLANSEEIKEILNPNIIYCSHFENQKIESFWETWGLVESQSLKNPNMLSLYTNKENLYSFIDSKIFKTYYKDIGYHIDIVPSISQGSMDVAVIFSKKGVPYHIDGFIATKENDKLILQGYQELDGIRTNKEKGVFSNNLPPVKFNGTITHSFTQKTPDGDKKIIKGEDLPKNYTITNENITIEDVTVKIVIKYLDNANGKIDIKTAKIERLIENPKK